MKKKIIYIVIVLMIIYIISIITLLFIGKKQNNNYDVEYLIVLGAKVENDYPTKVLKYRLDKANEVYLQNKKIKIVVSGGQGSDEHYTEASVMKKYLINIGVDEKNIIMEDQSTSTYENLLLSKKIIGLDNKVGVVTNDFHILRSKLICDSVFKEKCQMYSAKNSGGVLGLIAVLREPFAIAKSLMLDL